MAEREKASAQADTGMGEQEVEENILGLGLRAEIQDGDQASRRAGEALRDLLRVRLEESECLR